ncbi:MAG: site-specific DNA-methyltransferase [Enterococcus sp.]|nr:site-specific DNA-methyltransferase [Enterococcus sp.]
MPTLEWIGKNKVINHYQEVPFRILERKYSFDEDGEHLEDNSSENMIIHGDNLEALKALLPRYENKINCIYIDPPYNTGNEGWVYNDNVNDPKIKKWLGEVVGKEGEDLSRHDKWLCMMYPRLKLLHKLLAQNGTIFISIDDKEVYNLKLIMDDIFGANNFKANFIWQHRKSSQNDTDFSLSHNYTLVYAKDKSLHKFYPLPIKEDKFSNPDNDPRGPWVADPMDAPNIRPNLTYSITNPMTGIQYLPPIGRCWRILPEKFSAALADGRIIFGKNGKGRPQYKRYMFEAKQKGTNPFTIWNDVDTATNATKDIMKLFDGNKIFDTPKPTELIERILHIATRPGDIVLDSFAGSGTTAHAVLNMNKADGGNRKFILVEMMDYAESITSERVKRVIDGYGEGKNAVEGIGGDFSFYDLGEALLRPDGNLNETIDTQKIRDYIWYMETKAPVQPAENGNSYYLGSCRSTAYYFYYEKEQLTTLDHAFLATIPEQEDAYLIYADLY